MRAGTKCGSKTCSWHDKSLRKSRYRKQRKWKLADFDQGLSCIYHLRPWQCAVAFCACVLLSFHTRLHSCWSKIISINLIFLEHAHSLLELSDRYYCSFSFVLDASASCSWPYIKILPFDDSSIRPLYTSKTPLRAYARSMKSQVTTSLKSNVKGLSGPQSNQSMDFIF